MQVWLNAAGFFVCATEAEIEQAAEERRAKRAAEDAQRRARLDALRDEARTFNAGITLPVQWDVGIKDVLSGLSEGSWGMVATRRLSSTSTCWKTSRPEVQASQGRLSLHIGQREQRQALVYHG
ncbi:hypothetical protein [Aeromonas veronii]|uniref:hypothetical protein n=1 Tax=Aeromonas veronii TaxID=654 RepID=UPI001F0B62B0|nr:hypothetical protein [Aeromonas veronii]